jgi:metal-responsive CopG/Arc/MetJ family transcriptional regulator
MVNTKPPSDNVPLVIALSPSLLAAIDKAWHKRELPSRAATVRKLLEEALAQ